MKILLLLFLGFFNIPAGLLLMREQYILVSSSEKAVDSLMRLSHEVKNVNDNLRRAYSAAALITSAKYKASPFTKLAVFSQGRKLLESAVAKDSLLPEIRYLRLTIQQNAPAFLNYNAAITNDRAFLVSNIKSIRIQDPQLYASIIGYLLVYGDLTLIERKYLQTNQ